MSESESKKRVQTRWSSSENKAQKSNIWNFVAESVFKKRDAACDIFIYEESALYQVTIKRLRFCISQNLKVIGIIFMRADTSAGARHGLLWLNECKW